MRVTLLAAIGVILAGSPALAQTDPSSAAPPDTMAPAPAPAHHHHHRMHATSGGGERPIDVGPNTPQANAAYQGGGVILQGAPGAPAPTPQATPPGQVPANSVPP